MASCPFAPRRPVCTRNLESPRHEHPNVHCPKRVRGIAGGDREAKRRNGTYANRFCRPGRDEVSQISEPLVINTARLIINLIYPLRLLPTQ